MTLGSGRCHYHPDRAGLGVCVECRNVICAECSTQFEGINRCASCLAKKHAENNQVRARSDWSPFNLLLAMIGAGILFFTFAVLANVLVGAGK